MNYKINVRTKEEKTLSHGLNLNITKSTLKYFSKSIRGTWSQWQKGA